MANDGLVSTPLTEYPIDIISAIASHLDLCTLWNLLDTCRFFRYHLLAIRQVWRCIVIDLKHCTLSQVYAGLRRFRDTNGLRSLVHEVIMDGNDDPNNINFIIMLVKFPELRHLSARHRRFNTNLEADTKVLQELLKNGTLKPHSIPLERADIYHYYMNNEPHLGSFQKTLNRISKFPVRLDIRVCSKSPSSQTLEEAMANVTIAECNRIVSTEASCWACQYRFQRCWICESTCVGCQRKRLPPQANDQKRRHVSLEKKAAELRQIELDDEFSVFE
ncbi:hypothetical protein BJV82DRAFT_714394 [Fennellomyces sp. T-0311]|nr:hypothetical protein BJV82DRAFT_714394 [Fennellomyces sp. T-0311]